MGILPGDEASPAEEFHVDEPKEVRQAPFCWAHANLEPLRRLLLEAKEQGQFHPQNDLPL